MAPIARSKWPFWVSSNHTDSTTVRRLHCTFSDSCSIAWIACAHNLKLGTSRTRKSDPWIPLGNAGRGEQRLGFLDRRRCVGLVTDALEQFLGRCRELR